MELKKGNRPRWVRFAVTLLLILIAALVRAGLLSDLGTRAQYVTFFPAVIIASLYGGLPAGVLATVLSGCAVFVFWMESPGPTFTGQNPADLLGIAAFLTSGAMIAYVCEAMYRAQNRAAEAEAQTRIADQRRQADAAIRQAYDRLDLHVNNSPLAVIEWDSDFHILRWAGEAQAVFGWAADEVMGKRIDELPWVYEPDLPLVNQIMAEMMSGKSPSNVNRNRNVRKDGSVIYCEWYNTAIRDASGRLCSVLSQVLDVTDRKGAEAALQHSEAFVRRVLDSLYAFVGVLTTDGSLIEANRAALEAAGLTLEDVLGKPFDQTYWWSWSPDVQAQVRDAIERGARGESSRFDVTVRLSPQRFIPIDFMLFPLRNDEGTITHLIPSAVPIEARKQMERDLRQAKEDLEERVRERTVELSRTVDTLKEEVSRRLVAEQAVRERSEQLRLLASELTMGEQRERKRLASVLHDHLQQLLVGAKYNVCFLRREPADRIAQISWDLDKTLDACIEATRSLTAELSPPVLRNQGLLPALEWLARWMQEKHGLSVQISASKNIEIGKEETRVLLFEAIRELLFNVVKHSGTRTARVHVTRPGADLEVSVADDGKGFDPVKTLAMRPSEGSFGLFSIRERLDLIGGRLEINSATGKGASFRLTVPVD